MKAEVEFIWAIFSVQENRNIELLEARRQQQHEKEQRLQEQAKQDRDEFQRII